MDLRETVRRLGREQGFDGVGIARIEEFRAAPDTAFFQEWVELGFAGEMNYLKGEKAGRRADPSLVLPGVLSVICVAVVYNVDAPRSIDPSAAGAGWISRYGWGTDYHHVMAEMLNAFVVRLRQEIPQQFEARAYVDTGPVLERAFARQTALGWLGKNTCLIDQQLGSWFFLGEILTTLHLPPDQPAADRCGTCTRCIDACPTAAIVEPRVLDSTRCISYWTIEVKGDFPEEVVPGLGRHVFGCDICQDVCPWNRRAPATTLAEFQPRTGLVNPLLETLASMTEEEFLTQFHDSPVRRLGYRRFQRNVRAAMENSDR